MRRPAEVLRGAVLLAALLVTRVATAAAELDLDLRLVAASNGRTSFLDGGYGTLRYDATDRGLQLGRLRLAYRGSVGESWHGTLDVSAWSAGDRNLLDVTEAFVEWRPVPQTAWRSRVTLGAFYPPVSLEHRARGWSNPYTLSSSALNTWVGEELRTLGAEYRLEYLGSANDRHFDVGVQAAVYGWNDPAGVIVAWRGFALHDRQTPIFGRIGAAPLFGPPQRVLFREIDDRAGYYASAYLRHDSGLELRALHYDNRADPGAWDASIQDFAWDTRFNAFGLRHDSPRGTTLIAQWLQGWTDVTAGALNRWSFNTGFVLVAQQLGRHRLAARWDTFRVQQNRTSFPGPLPGERGRALTFAWTWLASDRIQVVTEWLDVDSRFDLRRRFGEPALAREHLLQVALKLSL